ncbi:MAG TPA: hypothetical protein VHD69_01640 [Candidatus Paceibacterota bacterium]|nr:hypothetical protein [Candidatus Paceibacterota bacterium]
MHFDSDIFVTVIVSGLFAGTLPYFLVYRPAVKVAQRSQELLDIAIRLGEINKEIFEARLVAPVRWAENSRIRKLVGEYLRLYDRQKLLLEQGRREDPGYIQTLRQV